MGSFLTNIGALHAQFSLRRIAPRITKAIARLSSGRRIISAADDPAGAAMEIKLRASLRSTEMARRNGQTAIAMMQIAEGGLNSSAEILIRMRELAVQAASDGLTDKERGYLDEEYQLLQQELTRQAASTEYNDQPLLSGESFTFQVGKNNHPGDQPTVDTPDITGGLDVAGTSIATREDAQDAIEAADASIDTVGHARARLGATINILESRVDFLSTKILNETVALSNIADVDVAAEAAELARLQIIQQAAVAMLAQANQSTAMYLKLLPGY